MESEKNMENFEIEIAHGLGRFSCLPQDLIMSIVNRIDDLKCLFQCTLVSKDFASKIYHIKTISLKLLPFDIDSIEAHTNRRRLFPFCFEQEISELPSPPPIRHKPNIAEFLQSFTELESIHFEFACPRIPCSYPSLKWKVKFGNCGPSYKTYVSRVVAEYKTEVNDEDGNEEFDKALEGCVLFAYTCLAQWLVLVFSVIERNNSLKSVICTDTDNHGKLVLNYEQIVEWRNRLLPDGLLYDAIPMTVIVGGLPYNLDLPLSRFRMKRFFFVTTNSVAKAECDEMLVEFLGV